MMWLVLPGWTQPGLRPACILLTEVLPTGRHSPRDLHLQQRPCMQWRPDCLSLSDTAFSAGIALLVPTPCQGFLEVLPMPFVPRDKGRICSPPPGLGLPPRGLPPQPLVLAGSSKPQSLAALTEPLIFLSNVLCAHASRTCGTVSTPWSLCFVGKVLRRALPAMAQHFHGG